MMLVGRTPATVALPTFSLFDAQPPVLVLI